MNRDGRTQHDPVQSQEASPSGEAGSTASAGFFDALRNWPKVIAHASSSRVLWVLAPIVVGQMVLAAAIVLFEQYLGIKGVAMVAHGQTQAAQAQIGIFYAVVSVLWAMSSLAMAALFGPMRKSLAVDSDTGQGFWWSIKAALWASPKLLLFSFLAFLAVLPAAILVAVTSPLVALVLAPPALIVVFLLAPAPWFVAGGCGIISAVKQALSLVRHNVFCFAAFFIAAIMLLLGCGCGAAVFRIIPIVGGIVGNCLMVLQGAIVWLLYVAVMCTLEAARGDLRLD